MCFSYRKTPFCVLWARCTRAVAPCLLCEELAVILVDGGGCGASAHPCEASASGLLSLGSSHPSIGAVGGVAGPGLTRACSPGHITASDLVPGPWALLPRLSPAIHLPPMGWLDWGVCVYLHILKCCLYYFLEILDLISSESLVSSCPGSFGREGGSAGLCLHPPASMAPDPQQLSGSPH